MICVVKVNMIDVATHDVFAPMQESMGDRLRRARIAANFTSAAKGAERIGVAASTYRAHENGQNEFGADEAEAYGRAFGVRAGWLLTGEQPKERGATPEMGIAPAADPKLKAEVSHPVDVPAWPTRKIPVFGQAAGGADDDGRFILNGNKVADVLILPGLEDVKDAYAVYVYGTSMVPAFKPGATVYVDPSRPIVAGDDVVVQVKMDEHEPPYGFVKEFVARRGGKLVLLQHNPPEGQDKTLTFPLDRVVAVHKVVGNVPR